MYYAPGRSDSLSTMTEFDVWTQHEDADEPGLQPGPSDPRAMPSANLARGAPTVGNDHAPGRMPLQTTIARVHDICIEATKKYLEDRYINRQMRNAATRSAGFPGGGHNHFQPQTAGRVSSQFYSYAAPTGFPRGVYNNPQSQPPGGACSQSFPYDTRRQSMPLQDATSDLANASTGSLLADVSRICDGIWSQSQRDRLYVPKTERLAVANMSILLHWAETVVWNSGQVAAGGLDEEVAFEVVVDAGSKLCRWLGDEDRQVMIEALWF